MSAATDAYVLRTEAERIVGEDRVPAEVLERLVADYGGGAHAGPPARTDWLGHRAAMVFVVAVRRIVDRRRPVLPAALRLDGAGAIEELFNAAYDSELAMLDELVERAGLGWRCQAEVGATLQLDERRRRDLRQLRRHRSKGKGGPRWMSSR